MDSCWVLLFVEVSVVVGHYACIFHGTCSELMDPYLVEFWKRVGVTKKLFIELHGLNGDIEDEVRQVLKVGFVGADAEDGELERLNNNNFTKLCSRGQTIS